MRGAAIAPDALHELNIDVRFASRLSFRPLDEHPATIINEPRDSCQAGISATFATRLALYTRPHAGQTPPAIRKVSKLGQWKRVHANIDYHFRAVHNFYSVSRQLIHKETLNETNPSPRFLCQMS